MKKKDFLAVMATPAESSIPDPQEAWQELQAAARVKSSIRVPQLRRALLEDNVFVTTTVEDRDDGMIISTVHRSKGREFKDVVLVIPEETDLDEFLDEGRVMFVGLTRARHSLYRMSEKGAAGIIKSGDRWLRRVFRNGRGRLSGIELGCRGDIDIHSPVSLSMFDDDPEDIAENQIFLWESVRHGSTARLELYRKSNGVPIYYIKISDGEDELAVGLTSERFGRSLKNIISEVQEARPSRYPAIIDDLWVRDVVTEVGNLGNKDVPREYRTTGLWLGVRLQGLGTCRDWRDLS